LSPPIVPTIRANIATIIILFILKHAIKSRGATFCQVNKIKHWGQCKHCIMFGNQKCRGGIPAFISREKKIKISNVSILIARDDSMIRLTLIISMVEAKAWIRKYLIEASTSILLTLISIRGVILIRLISSPSQLVNQELAGARN